MCSSMCSSANARARACALFSHCARAAHQYSASIKPTFKICAALINTSICAPPKIALSNINDVTRLDRQRKLKSTMRWKQFFVDPRLFENTFSMNLEKQSKDGVLHYSLTKATDFKSMFSMLQRANPGDKPMQCGTTWNLNLWRRKLNLKSETERLREGSQSKRIGEQRWWVVSRQTSGSVADHVPP